MNILVLNQDWFVEEWRAAGHSVYSCGLASHLDIIVETPLLHIDSVINLLPNQFRPDVIVVLDNSSPIIFTGFEETNIPTVFYSVDTHHHVDYHKYLADLFDYTLIAQKDYESYFTKIGNYVEWMPLFAPRIFEASSEKRYGAVFVGNLNLKLNPKRVEFFETLQKQAHVFCTTGKYWEIFPHSEIVINQTVKGDLNFRVFESLMSGAMLLTENTDNGLSKLFIPDQHLVHYNTGDVNQAAEKINTYLSNRKNCREIGMYGREEVLKKHTARHRADRFIEILKDLKKKTSKRKYLAAMANFTLFSIRAEEIDTSVSIKSLVAALKSLAFGLQFCEEFDSQLACYAVAACIKYDQYLKTGAGIDLLNQLSDSYGEEPVFRAVKLRNLLNVGKISDAKILASIMSERPIEETFRNAEELFGMIVSGSYIA